MKEFSLKSHRGKCILFATILASGMAFLDGSVVNIAIPAIQKELHATLTGIQWVVNGYALMLCALILISGAIGDRYGRKKIFVYGIALFVISSILCALSHSVMQLAFFRALQGIGGAMMVPGSLSLINMSFPESERGKAIGLWSGFAGGVAALGPFVGGWLVQSFGWPSIFFINVPLGLLAIALAIRFIPESRNHESTKIDILGALLIFLSLLGIAFGLISVPDLGWTNPLIIFSLAAGIVLFILFIYLEKHIQEPLVPFHMFKSPLVVGANLVTFFLYFALSGLIFFFILNLQQIQHYPPILAGMALLPTIFLITFLSGFGGSLADKKGPRLQMIIGPFIVSLGMLLLALPGRNADFLTQFLPGLLLFGMGMALVIAPLTKSALDVDKKYSGAASGVNNAVSRIAGLLAVALLGVIIVSLFSTRLQKNITASHLNSNEKQQIISQQNKLAGIEIPENFTSQSKIIAQNAIEDSFIYGFKWVMGINAFLAFLSAVISFYAIRNKSNIN